MLNRFLTTLFFSVLILGCRKMDREILQTPQSNLQRAKEHYFETPPLTNPSVKRVAEFIRESNRSKNFVEKLIKFDGIAVWDKALVGIVPKMNESTIVKVSSNSTATASSNSGGADTVMYIPLVPQEGKSVYSFVKAVVNGDSIKWQLYSGRDYDTYKHGSLKAEEVNAEKLAAITMLLDYEVFGYTKFIITNPDLFRKNKKSRSPIKITLNPNNISSSLSGSLSQIRVKSDSYYWVTYCFTFEENYCPYIESGGLCGAQPVCDIILTNQCATGLCGPITRTECYTNVLSIPEGNGGGGVVENPPPNGGNGGNDGIPGNGDSPDDPCDFDSPCGELGWTSDKALAINLRLALGISQSEYSDFFAWVVDNPEHAIAVRNFLTNSNLDANEKILIARSHINELKESSEYKTFVSSYMATNPNKRIMWWEDNVFIDNSTNISFDTYGDGQVSGYEKLNPQEKALVKKYPVHAWRFNKNRDIAFQVEKNIYGFNGLNSKGDAFRHCFFNALNYISCKDLIGLTYLGFAYPSNVAKLFGEAHESDTPIELQKEKEMDLFNNEFGYYVASDKPLGYSVNNLTIEIFNYLVTGSLRYLKPIWDQDPAFFITHGITSATQLVPTNQ